MKEAILCVDDEALMLLSLKTSLARNLGDEFIYETALDVEQAWEIIEELFKDKVDLILIISDWLMPGVKGDEFLIDVYKKYPTIKAIMLSGQIEEKYIEKVKKEANLIGFFSKPCRDKDLIKCIKDNM